MNGRGRALGPAFTVNHNHVISAAVLKNRLFVNLSFVPPADIQLRMLKFPLPFSKPLRIIFNADDFGCPFGPKKRGIAAAELKNRLFTVIKLRQILNCRICIPGKRITVTVNTDLFVNRPLYGKILLPHFNKFLKPFTIH